MQRLWVMALIILAAAFVAPSTAYAQEEEAPATDQDAEAALEKMRAELGNPPPRPANTPEAIAKFRAEYEKWMQRREELYIKFIKNHQGTDTALGLRMEMALGKMQSAGGPDTQLEDVIAEVEDIAASAQGKELKAQATYYSGAIHDQLENWDKAIAAYEKAAEISPDPELAMYAKKGAHAAKVKRDGLLDVGKKPIDFEVKAFDGETTISPDMYEGKVVLIDFWATWCQPCVRELPVVLDTYEQFHDKGFEIIGISLDSNKEALERFLAERNLPWVQFYDGKGWSNQIAEMYAIQSIPATFLLNQKGEIAHKDLRGEDLPKAVAKLLGEEYEGGSGDGEPVGKRPVVGDMLPAFEAKTMQGEAISPESLKGKVVLVDFWATWCPPCIKELPHVKEAFDEYKDKGFTVVGISLDQPQDISAEKVTSFAKDRELGWPMVYEGAMEIALQYGISSIPSTFLVDRTGKIRAVDLRGDALIKEVATLVAEQ
ncbi:MAG: redoxin domain-containing protein [Planctomycetota bacterium]